MTRVLVSGATGFVGGALCKRLLERGCHVLGAVRASEQIGQLKVDVEPVIMGDMACRQSNPAYLAGVDVVVHLAARVHVMKDRAIDPLAEFRVINVSGTEHLARQAASAGCSRFVYLSSIKVNGEATAPDAVLTELDSNNPQDSYAISKAEAEMALHRIAIDTGMEVVILRPPLVYGAHVKGNFLTMLHIVERGVPLPFLRVANRRSFIYVGNLADAIAQCVQHQAAANETFLVSDGYDVSTPELLRELARCLGASAKLFPVPEGLLRLAGKLTGRYEELNRLMDSLVIDSGKIRRNLEWSPPHTFGDGIQRTVNWFKGIS